MLTRCAPQCSTSITSRCECRRRCQLPRQRQRSDQKIENDSCARVHFPTSRLLYLCRAPLFRHNVACLTNLHCQGRFSAAQALFNASPLHYFCKVNFKEKNSKDDNNFFQCLRNPSSRLLKNIRIYIF